MTWKLTAITPFLVGDGHRLSPIDYMVWKDQVSVLDQQRIFRLLSKGPRLDGYLNQLRKAEKLDFASWGGFAQNYAERRIPFESPSLTPAWQAERAEYLHIPTFCAGPRGAFLPASAVKGALRTAVAYTRWNEGVIRELVSRQGDRPLRKPGEAGEAMTLGTSGNDPLRVISAGDSDPVSSGVFRIYLIRVAAITQRGPKPELGWKQAGRGYAAGNKPGDATPVFAEMAPPGTSFSGAWKVSPRTPVRRDQQGHERIFQAANEHATKLVELHRNYAESAGLNRVRDNLDAVAAAVRQAAERPNACVLNLGWAGGFLSKAAFPDTSNEEYRKLLRTIPLYERAIRTGLPFPKTRKVIFERGEPSTLPGWATLEIN